MIFHFVSSENKYFSITKFSKSHHRGSVYVKGTTNLLNNNFETHLYVSIIIKKYLCHISPLYVWTYLYHVPAKVTLNEIFIHQLLTKKLTKSISFNLGQNTDL